MLKSVGSWLRAMAKRVSGRVAIPLIVAFFAIWQTERQSQSPNRFILYGALVLLAVVISLWLSGSTARTWRFRSPIYRPERKTQLEIQEEEQRREATLRAHAQLGELFRGYVKPAYEALTSFIEACRTQLETQPEPLRSVGILSGFVVSQAADDYRDVERDLEGWREFAKPGYSDQDRKRLIELTTHSKTSEKFQWNLGMFYGAYHIMALWAPRLALFAAGNLAEGESKYQYWKSVDDKLADKMREQASKVGMETLMELVDSWTKQPGS